MRTVARTSPVFSNRFARFLSGGWVAAFLAVNHLGSAALPTEGWTQTSALDTSATADAKYDESARVATDGSGNWVAVWQSSGNFGNDFDILVSQSSDDGAHWSSPAALVANAVTDSSDDLNPTVVTDRNGNWVVAWQANNGIGSTLGSDQDILCVRSSNNGTTWSFPVPLNIDAASDSKHDVNVALACNGLDTWVACWTTVQAGGGSPVGQRLYCSTSTSNGAAWALPIQIDSKALTPSVLTEPISPDISTDGFGKWVVVSDCVVNGDFDIVYYVSADSGLSWSPRSNVSQSATVDSGGDFSPRLANDGRGNWIVVWYSNDTLEGIKGFDEDILFARTSDLSSGWSAPGILNSNALVDTRQDRLPFVVTDTFGNWITVWNSNDDTLGAKGLDYDIMFSRSTNNGKDWSPQTIVNDSATTDVGLDARGHIAASGLGTWIATWHTNDTLGNTIGDDGDILTARAGFLPILSDLRVEGVSLPATIFAGQETTVTATVTNDGPSKAEAITLTQGMPSGSVLLSAKDATGDDCVVSGTELICAMGSLEEGESASAVVHYQLFNPEVNEHPLQVTSDAIDLVDGNNSTVVHTTVNSLTDVSVSINDSIDPALLQKPFQYTITALNSGPSPADGIEVQIQLPSNIQLIGTPTGPGTFNAADPFNITWTVGSLGDDATAAAVLTVRATSYDSATVLAQIQTTDPESDGANNSASQSTDVIPAVDLSVVLVDTPDPVFVTRPLTLTAHVFNGGPADATEVSLAIPLPANCVFNSATGAPFTQSGGTTNFDLGTIAANTTSTVSIEVIPQAVGIVTSSASVFSLEAEADTANNNTTQQTIVRPPADLQVTILPTASSTPVLGELGYTVLLTNHGPSDATGVQVIGSLSSKFDLTSFTVTQGSYTSGTWSVGTVPSGGTAELKIGAKAWEDGPTSFTVSATLIEFDNVLSNNTSNADVVITSTGAEINGFWVRGVQKCIARKCKVTYKFFYTNSGIAHSQPARMRVYLSEDEQIDGSDVVLSEVVLFPKPKNLGKSRTIKRSVKLDPGVVATGKYLIAVLDSDNNVGEQNERNNKFVSTPVE